MAEINKPILSIETSGEICGASVYFNEQKYFEINILGKNIHSEKLLEIIESVLKLAECKINDIGSIAISSGPGSFTGLRIGMSAAKGLAFGLNIPIISVSTFEALALQISSGIEENTRFAVCNKVNNEEFYVGKYLSQMNSYKILEEVKVIKAEEFAADLNGYNLIYGNIKLTDEFKGTHKYISAPNSVFISRWAYFFGKDSLIYNYDFLEPNYLKNFVIR